MIRIWFALVILAPQWMSSMASRRLYSIIKKADEFKRLKVNATSRSRYLKDSSKWATAVTYFIVRSCQERHFELTQYLLTNLTSMPFEGRTRLLSDILSNPLINLTVRVKAADTLGQFPDSEAICYLKGFLDIKDQYNQIVTTYAKKLMVSQGLDNAYKNIKRGSESWELRWHVLQALSRLKVSPSIKLIFPYLGNKQTSSDALSMLTRLLEQSIESVSNKELASIEDLQRVEVVTTISHGHGCNGRHVTGFIYGQADLSYIKTMAREELVRRGLDINKT